MHKYLLTCKHSVGLVLFMILALLFSGVSKVGAQQGADSFVQKMSKRMDAFGHYKIGNGITMIDTTGRRVAFSQYQGKTCYIAFWFPGCAPCATQTPFWNELCARFASDTSVVFLAVAVPRGCTPDYWRQYIREHKFSGTHLSADIFGKGLSKLQQASRALRVKSFPTYMILNKKGELIGYDATSPSDRMMNDYVISEATKGVYPSQSSLRFVDYALNIHKKPDAGFIRWIESFYKMPYQQALARFLATGD